jgi:CRISPR-associated protein Csx10
MKTGMLKIKMLSDWHVGSGMGRPGSIDRLVQRDEHHLPYIPAKSLTGIWRDGCELVAQGLDGGSYGTWQQWIDWLFGEQQPEESANRRLESLPQVAQLSVRSAHFSTALQQAFQGNVLLQSMTTFVKPGVKINRHTGSALDQHLRFEEMTRSGAVLEAGYSLQLAGLSPEQQAIAQALLVCGAAMVERLGAKRRRGAGRCQIGVEGLGELNKAIATIEKTQGVPPSVPNALPHADANEMLTLETQDNGTWWRVELEVEPQSPVIIHKRTVGNHQETQDYIPGTYFLPILLKELRSYLGQFLAEANLSLSNALMHGDVVITNATPLVAGQCGQAVPFSLFEAKAKPGGWAEQPRQPIRQRLGEVIHGAAGEQLKGMRQGYLGWDLDAQALRRMTINHEIFAHNTIADAKQRPDLEVGGIYTYEAIPAGLILRLEVRIRDYLVPKNAVNPWAGFLKTPLSIQLGRTKKDDYGKAQIKNVRSAKIIPGDKPPKQVLNVLLLSDLLLRDGRLRPTADPQVLVNTLSQALDVRMTLVEAGENGLPQIDRWVALTRTNRTESWQTKWGLPRPSLVGLSAGSVLQLEISGLGERTAEGYGQLCFNPPILMNAQINLDRGSLSPAVLDSVGIAPNTPGYEYAQLIERETWREMMRRIAGAIAADPSATATLQDLSRNTSKLSRSKLGTLRSLVDSLSNRRDANRVATVLARMEEKENWKGKTLNYVKKLVQDEAEVWRCYQEMGGDFSQYRLTQNTPSYTESVIKEELWAEAVRILVDACIRAHKRASETFEQDESNG